MDSMKRAFLKIMRSPVTHVLKFLFVIFGVIWFVIRGGERLGYNWQWYQIPKYIFTFDNGEFVSGPFLDGLMITFRITGVSLVLAFTIGLVTALFRLSNSILARTLARIYLELVRNTPLLVQLFFIYFVLSPILDINAFTSAVMALSLFEGAYISEMIRAGIVSIHRGQWEGAYSLGLSLFHTYRYIIIPQALRRVLPPLTSQSIALIKDSALVSTIAIYDLTMQGNALVSETFLTFEIWFTVAAIYLLITATLSFLVNFMEHRFMPAS
jgi:polar amino acid transport system permease protein